MKFEAPFRLLPPHLPQAAVFAVAVSLLPSCGPKDGEDAAGDPVAIKVGSREVRLSELQADLDDLAERRNPLAAQADSFIPQSVERLVALEKARELGIDGDHGLRRQWENLVIGRLREVEIESRLREIVVSDEEVEEYYNRNQASYGRPAQLHLALLFLSVPANAGEDDRKAVRARMEEARTLALELADDVPGFDVLGMEYSEEATSRFKGGDIGWLQAGASAYRWPAEVVNAGFELDAIGAISEVIDTPGGFYLLRKIDYRAAAVRSLEGRLRASITNALLGEKRAEIERGLMEDWRQAHPVTLHEEIIRKLEFKSSHPTSSISGES